jgi:hypothetical protein
MSFHPEFRDHIRCLGLDQARTTVLEGGGIVHNVKVEVVDNAKNPLPGEPVLVSLSPRQARDLASSLWQLADHCERIAAGLLEPAWERAR